MMNEYLPEPQAATYLGLSPHTLQKYRGNGSGPSFYKFGRRVLYRVEDLQTWAQAQHRNIVTTNHEVNNV